MSPGSAPPPSRGGFSLPGLSGPANNSEAPTLNLYRHQSVAKRLSGSELVSFPEALSRFSFKSGMKPMERAVQ